MLLTAIQIIRAFTAKLRDDSISAFAAQAAFFIILSFIPFIMFLFILLNLLPATAGDFKRLPAGILSGIAALWSSSRGTLALIRGLNAVYKQKETRNYFHIRAISMIYTLCFAALLIVALALHLLNLLPPATPVFLTLFFLLLYLVFPNRKSRLFAELPGAVISAGGWIGFSFLFSFYIDHRNSNTFVYGNLTTLALTMLWLYFCMYILFVGAEINVFLTACKGK